MARYAIHTHRDGTGPCYCNDASYQATPSEQQTYVVAHMAKMDAGRVAAKVCRHCGGPLPCWSPFGDASPGVKNT